MNRPARTANYVKSIDVAAPPERVFKALTHEMRQWWTTQAEGVLVTAGDRVRVDFPPNNGHWTFEATQLTPGETVELKCIDARHIVAGQPEVIEKEWLGTILRWHISAHPAGTRVELEHVGLTPALHCFDICNEGWDYFFGSSFAAYLNKGIGSPHSPG